MELFSIACTTCRSKLKVRDTAAIGQILGCPKCGSMVLVAPPPGWQMPAPPPSLAATPDPAAVTSAPVGPWRNDSSEFGPAVGAASIPANLPAFADSPAPWPAWLPWACVPVAALLSAVGVWVWLETANAEVAPADAAQRVAAVVDSATPTPQPKKPEVVSSQLPVAGEPQALRSEPAAAATAPPTVVEPTVPSQPLPTSPSLQPSASSPQPAKHDPFAPQMSPATAPASSPQSPASSPAAPAQNLEPPATGHQPPGPSLQPPASRLQPVPEADPLPPVDVTARLADPLPAIEFRDTRLTQFLAFWSQASTVPVAIDIESMLDMGMRPTDVITLKLRDATLGDALAEALAERRLASVIQNGSIVITPATPDPHTAETVTYDVASLVREDALGLVQLVRQCVEPTSWAEVGGLGSAAYEKGKLVVHQRPAAQRQVARLLDRLRLARGESPQSKLDPRRLSLDTRSAQAKSKLATLVSVSQLAPQPLERPIDKLAGTADVDVIYDEPALAAVGRRRDSEASVVAANVPLGDALDKLLAPLGLAFIAIDDRTLLVTSHRAARARLETEFYRVSDLVPAVADPDKLIARLKSVVGAAWGDGGPNALVRFDAHASCLIVHHSQAVQRQVEALLATMHQEPSTKN